MAEKTPLTLDIDDNKATGVKEFSEPNEECLGVEHGGFGRIIIEGNHVLIGNNTEPTITIPRKTLTDKNSSIIINGSDSFISGGDVTITIDNSNINATNIMSSQKIPLNKVGRWVEGYQGWEQADDRLFLEIIDPGEF